MDHGFMTSLRKQLTWTAERDPTLSDLHPSLGNLDHVARLIDIQRNIHFPNGTGFEGTSRALITGSNLMLYENRCQSNL